MNDVKVKLRLNRR